MISDLCEQDQCETCWPEEAADCRCGCHSIPIDSLAGCMTTTEQPSTGMARQARIIHLEAS